MSTNPTHRDPVTPHYLAGVRKCARQSRREYQAARVAALAAGVALRAVRPRGGRALLDYERAMGVVLDARRLFYIDKARVQACLKAGVVKGARVSPAARERAFASGRWHRPDS